jgi:competence protein ComQ
LIDKTLTWLIEHPCWRGPTGWRTVISTVLGCQREALRRDISPARLPLLCAEAVDCSPKRARPVTAAWIALYVSAHLFDAVEDGEYVPHAWQGVPQAQALNAASALLAAVPLLLTTSDGDAALHTALIVDFQQTALTMAAGQHADLAQWIETDEDVLARYWQVTDGKSGALFALACRAGAQLGAPSPEVIEAYADFGETLGRLLQLCDDYRDTYLADRRYFGESRASLPLIYGRMVADAEEKETLEALRAQAAADPEAAVDLLQRLDALGARHYLLLQIEHLREVAQTALDRAAAPDPSREKLLALLPCTTELCQGS